MNALHAVQEIARAIGGKVMENHAAVRAARCQLRVGDAILYAADWEGVLRQARRRGLGARCKTDTSEREPMLPGLERLTG